MKLSKKERKLTFSVKQLPVLGILLLFVLGIFLVKHIFAAGNNSFAVTLCPHGLGNCGDSINTNGQANIIPKHTTRTVTLTLYDATNNPTTAMPGTVTYSQTAQNFQGTINNVSAIPNGTYSVSIKMDGFLRKQLPGTITVTSGQTNTIPLTPLMTGDINNDDQLDIMDYNSLISCFGVKMTTTSCLNPPTSQAPGADLDDNGTIDGADYNLLLREFSVKIPTPTTTPAMNPTATPLVTPTPTTMQPTPTMKPPTPTTKPTLTPTTVQGTITMTKTITQQGVTNVESMQMPVAGGNLTGTITQDCQGTITGTYTGAPNYKMTGSSPIHCLIGGVVSFDGTNAFTGTIDPNAMTATINYTVTGPGVNQTGTEVFNYTIK